MPRAGSSISLQASNDFHGNSALRSTSAAWGATFSSQKVRRVSRNSRWTSVRAKAAALTTPFSQARLGRRSPRLWQVSRSSPPVTCAERWRSRSSESSAGAVSGIQCDTFSRTSKV